MPTNVKGEKDERDEEPDKKSKERREKDRQALLMRMIDRIIMI